MRRSNIFTDLITKGTSQSQLPARNREAIEWYRNAARGVKTIARKRLIRDLAGEDVRKDVTTNKGFEIGSMYIYQYDPKWKAELPVYDTFPCIFVIDITKNHFLGINFHYLNYRQRAQLMDILYTITSNKRFDSTTKLRITYQILKAIAKKKLYAPTIHLYLKKKLKSKLLYIHPTEWDIAIFLPIARFHGPKAGEYSGH